MLYLTNVGLGDDSDPVSNAHVAALHEYAATDGGGAPVAGVCAVLEEELMLMNDAAERSEFLTELGVVLEDGPEGTRWVQAD